MPTSPISKLSLDDMFGPPDPPPVPEHIEPPSPHQNAVNFLSYSGWALAIFFAAMYISTFPGCKDRIAPHPNPDVNVPGPTVLITEDDHGSAGQAIVLNTTKVQSWCEENNITYRLIDVENSTDKMEPYWGELVKASASPPALTIATPKGMVTESLPESIEDTITRIKNVIRN